MKGILMILSLLFLTACGAQEMAAGEAAVERDMVGVTESAPEEAAEAPADNRWHALPPPDPSAHPCRQWSPCPPWLPDNP